MIKTEEYNYTKTRLVRIGIIIAKREEKNPPHHDTSLSCFERANMVSNKS